MYLDEFHPNFSIIDALDILLISVVLYSVLVWFKQAASRRIVIGVTLVGLVYLVARGLDMYLTLLLFHAGFAVLLVVLVVIFQEDLRRAFEYVSQWGSVGRFRRPTSEARDVDTLVETVFTLATDKVGAIIALRGRDSLDRHVHGGVPLNGSVSQALLLSLFDPHSAGHDGAVIIEDGRVERFGVHLPISKNLREIRDRGTRHGAALGLAECSDALVVVVSEERGVVSIAENGRIREMPTPSELKERLERFYRRILPTQTEPVWKRLLTQDARLKLVSVSVAVVAWFLLAYNEETIQRTIVVPVEYRNVPQGLSIDQWAPTDARVTLTGSERAFRFLEPTELAIAIDLSQAQEGTVESPITDRHLGLPANVAIYRVEPRVIRLELQKVQRQSTPPAAPPQVSA